MVEVENVGQLLQILSGRLPQGHRRLPLDKPQSMGYMYRQEVKPMSSAETQKQFQIYKWVHKELHSYNVVRSRTSVFVYPLLHLRCYDAVV